MKVMVLECNLMEQKEISDMLCDCEVVYQTTVPKAISHLGMEHVDLALIDADYDDCEETIYNWKELKKFLDFLNIEYTIFSSNGKVGIKNGQRIISIKDIQGSVKMIEDQ